VVREACFTPERPICSKLPSGLVRYMFQIRYGCWSLLYGGEGAVNFWYHGMLAVHSSVLVPSGSLATVGLAVPSLTLFFSVADGVITMLPLPSLPVQPWQRENWA